MLQLKSPLKYKTTTVTILTAPTRSLKFPLSIYGYRSYGIIIEGLRDIDEHLNILFKDLTLKHSREISLESIKKKCSQYNEEWNCVYGLKFCGELSVSKFEEITL